MVWFGDFEFKFGSLNQFKLKMVFCQQNVTKMSTFFKKCHIFLYKIIGLVWKTSFELQHSSIMNQYYIKVFFVTKTSPKRHQNVIWPSTKYKNWIQKSLFSIIWWFGIKVWSQRLILLKKVILRQQNVTKTSPKRQLY